MGLSRHKRDLQTRTIYGSKPAADESLLSAAYPYTAQDSTPPAGTNFRPGVLQHIGGGAHPTKTMALERCRRRGCIGAFLGVFSTPSPFSKNLKFENRSGGCDVWNVTGITYQLFTATPCSVRGEHCVGGFALCRHNTYFFSASEGSETEFN